MGFLDSGGRQAKTNGGSVGHLVAVGVTGFCYAFPPIAYRSGPGVVDSRPITLDRQPWWPYHNDGSQVVQSQERTSPCGYDPVEAGRTLWMIRCAKRSTRMIWSLWWLYYKACG